MADSLPIGPLQIFPLLSAGAWFALAGFRIRHQRVASPLEIALTVFPVLLGAWIVLDWARFGLLAGQPDAIVVAVSIVGLALISAAVLALLLSAKWLLLGHSRWDAALAVPPALGLLPMPLGGGIRPVAGAGWGVAVDVDVALFLPWAAVQLTYVLAAAVLLGGLSSRIRRFDPKVRRLFLGVAGGFLLLFLVGTVSAVANLVTGPLGYPWYSSAMGLPAVLLLGVFGRLRPEDFADLLRAVSRVEERVVAVQAFYRDGQPLVSLSSRRLADIDTGNIQGILRAIEAFVETSLPLSRGYAVTGVRFEGQGVLAVRGQYVIAVAVYDGPAYDAVRSGLVRAVREFEDDHWAQLGTWEGATRLVEAAAEKLSAVLGSSRADDT